MYELCLVSSIKNASEFTILALLYCFMPFAITQKLHPTHLKANMHNRFFKIFLNFTPNLVTDFNRGSKK